MGALSLLISLQFTSIIGMLLIALSVYSGAFILPILVGLAGIKVKPKQVSMAIALGGILALAGKLVANFGNSDIGNIILLLAFAGNGFILFLGVQRVKK